MGALTFPHAAVSCCFQADSHLLAELQTVLSEKAALEEEKAAAQVGLLPLIVLLAVSSLGCTSLVTATDAGKGEHGKARPASMPLLARHHVCALSVAWLAGRCCSCAARI